MDILRSEIQKKRKELEEKELLVSFIPGIIKKVQLLRLEDSYKEIKA
jgi:hypothetical protein